jgi:hypothetical protein
MSEESDQKEWKKLSGHKPKAGFLIGTLIVAVAILLASRWQVTSTLNSVYLLDRWTGAIVACKESMPHNLHHLPSIVDCNPVVEGR